MPNSFAWRDKKKANKEKANKDAFKQWCSGKKKVKDMKDKPSKKGEKKAARMAAGKGNGRGAGEDSAKGKGKGRGGGSQTREASIGLGDFKPPPLSTGPKSLSAQAELPAGVSKGLVDQLLAMKKKLLAGGDDVPAQDDAGKEEKKSAKGKGKGKGKDDLKGKGKGKGKKRGADGDGNEKAPKRSAMGLSRELWLAPPEQVNREERVAMNRKIAEYAQAKDLAGARRTIADLEQRGWANGHTYTAAVNALCRCGDWRAAFAALRKAEAGGLFKKQAGAVSGLIARTAMIRGFCENARDLGRAKALIDKMEKQEVIEARPNVRTANTFLRGCLMLGSVGEAEELLRRMEEEWSPNQERSDRSPDASSYETAVSLLCQALRYDDASKLAKRALTKLGPSPGSAAMYVGVARAAAVRGELEAASKYCSRAKELLSAEDASQWGGGNDIVGSGGKRGMKKVPTDGDSGEARVKSLEVFQTHRNGELHGEVKDIEQFISGTGAKKKQSTDAKRVDLGQLWAHTVSFDDFVQLSGAGAGGAEDPTTAQGASHALCRRLSERFGMPVESTEAKAAQKNFEASMLAEAPRQKRSKKQRLKAAKAAAAGDSAEDQGAQKAERGTPILARLDLRKIFVQQRPLHVELCSGGGEWLCAQALRDSSANWMACELRFDRASRCFQRIALRGLAASEGNAGLIAGDAREALERRTVVGCCDRIFVNHPEPPHQKDLETALGTSSEVAGSASAVSSRPHGNGKNPDWDCPKCGMNVFGSKDECFKCHVRKDGSEGGAVGSTSVDAKTGGDGAALEPPHLLTMSFIRDGIAQALKQGGTLTICTDSQDYGKWLLKVVGSAPLSDMFEDALKGSKAAKLGKVAHHGNVALRSTPPDPEVCGAQYSGADGASYFQRLKMSEKSSRWQAQEEERYFLCLKKK